MTGMNRNRNHNQNIHDGRNLFWFHNRNWCWYYCSLFYDQRRRNWLDKGKMLTIFNSRHHTFSTMTVTTQYSEMFMNSRVDEKNWIFCKHIFLWTVNIGFQQVLAVQMVVFYQNVKFLWLFRILNFNAYSILLRESITIIYPIQDHSHDHLKVL